MAAMKADEIYRQHIKPLPPAERLRILALIGDDLAQAAELTEKPRHKISELHGLGKEIWENIDAQQYVNEIREEWDHRQ